MLIQICIHSNKSLPCIPSMFPHHLPSISLWIHLIKARQILKNHTHLQTQTYPNCQVPRKPWLVNHYGTIAYLLTTGISFLIVPHPYKPYPQSHLVRPHFPKWYCMSMTGCKQVWTDLDSFVYILIGLCKIQTLQCRLRICWITTSHRSPTLNQSFPLIFLDLFHPGHSRICQLTYWLTGWWQEVAWNLSEKWTTLSRMLSMPKISALMTWLSSTHRGSITI